MVSKNRREILNVLMLLEFFPPIHSGTGKQALFLAKALEKEEVKCSFMTFNWLNHPAHEFIDSFEVTRFTRLINWRLNYLLFSLKVILMLIRKRTYYDIVHFHSVWPFAFLITVTCKILKKPTVIKLTLEGADDPETLSKKSFLCKIERNFLKYINKVICISSGMKKICIDSGINGDHISYIPNGVDTNIFRPLNDSKAKEKIREKLTLPKNVVIVTFVGRLGLRKGTDILFDAWNKVRMSYSNAVLLLIGPSEIPHRSKVFWITNSKTSFEVTIEELKNKAGNDIIFMGEQEKVFEYLQASDIFIFPSRKEGLPNAVIEAMSCGLPVIMTRINGVTEDLIRHDVNGIIVENEDTKGVVIQLVRLVSNIELCRQLGEKAREKAEQVYSFDNVANKYKKMYMDLLK